MTYYSRQDLAHEFFYNDGKRHYPSYSSCGYDGNRFFSYSTLIAKIETALNGERVCLISIDSMSNTTAKHLSAVWCACPLKRIPVYMEYGENDGGPEDFAQRAIKNMAYYSGQKLTQQANRREFMTAFNSFQQLAENFKLSVKMPAKYKKLADIIENSKTAKELKERAERRAMLDAKNAARRLNKLLKNTTLADAARAAYDRKSTDLTADERETIRKTINPHGDLSFVWFDKSSDMFKTSQGISMPAAEGLTALKLWVSGRLKHGLKVGYYTVLEVMPDYVKIGCHKILTRN